MVESCNPAKKIREEPCGGPSFCSSTDFLHVIIVYVSCFSYLFYHLLLDWQSYYHASIEVGVKTRTHSHRHSRITVRSLSHRTTSLLHVQQATTQVFAVISSSLSHWFCHPTYSFFHCPLYLGTSTRKYFHSTQLTSPQLTSKLASNLSCCVCGRIGRKNFDPKELLQNQKDGDRDTLTAIEDIDNPRRQ